MDSPSKYKDTAKDDGAGVASQGSLAMLNNLHMVNLLELSIVFEIRQKLEGMGLHHLPVAEFHPGHHSAPVVA